jgi:hypothetical protein
MRYRLRTLLTFVAIGPPVLAAMWFMTKSVVGMVGWAIFTALFAIWYAMLKRSQALDPSTRGKPDYSFPPQPPDLI